MQGNNVYLLKVREQRKSIVSVHSHMLRRVFLPNLLLLTTPRAAGWTNRAYTSSTQPRTATTMAQQQQKQQPSLVWIDCEMTGLASTDKLIEIAVIITDDDLNIIAEGPNLIIHQPKEVMDSMNQWCVDHHGAVSLPPSARFFNSFQFHTPTTRSTQLPPVHPDILTLPSLSFFLPNMN